MIKRFYIPVLFLLSVIFYSCSTDPVYGPTGPQSDSSKPGLFYFSKALNDTVSGVPVITIGKIIREQGSFEFRGIEPLRWDFVVSFENTSGRKFEVIQDSLPALLKDDEGTIWSIEGIGLKGPEAGERLIPANGSLGYWYAFATRYPGLSIEKGPSMIINVQQTDDEEWDVPTQTIVRGAPIDWIPSIERPSFVTENERKSEPYEWSDEEPVIGVTLNGESRCYPISVLNRHEIVNDIIDGTPISILYHPYTATTRVWITDSSTPSFGFGVSGLLYEHNMIPFDRLTKSNWVQLENTCVNGSRRGEQQEILPFVETTFDTWKQIAPDTRILSSETGFPFFYDEDPLPGFATDEQFLTAPISYDDDRLPRKERVFGLIIDGDAAVYTQQAFQ